MTIPLSASRLHVACAGVAMIALHSCIPEPACAATPLQLRWTAELSDPKPYNVVLFQGESADLVATLKLYGRAVAIEDSATASLYYQTNGMGSAWWQSPATVTTAGVVTASWTPAMDAGADLYRWHLGVANAASSTIYRAFGAFRMQPSPGAAPNALAPPVRWIDFDLVAVSNPPWATPADVAEATEGMLVEESDPAWAAVSNAVISGAAAGSTAVQAEADTLATVTSRGATTTEAVTIGSRGAGAVGLASFANGVNVVASGAASYAEGRVCTASGYYSHASGFNSVASNITAFAWQGAASGQYAEPEYGSHGNGTYNINPVGGLEGLWIGETNLATTLSCYATTGAVAAVQAEVAGKADAETVVSGAVCVATAGNRYFWTTETNVVLSVNLASGQVVNLAKLNNMGATSITAIGEVGWEWTGGEMTNTIPSGKSMTFGFLVDAATGKTNAYATGVSK